MMSEGASASQALKHAYIWNTVVWNLPLRLDQYNMNSLKLLKKLDQHLSVSKLLPLTDTNDTVISNDEELVDIAASVVKVGSKFRALKCV